MSLLVIVLVFVVLPLWLLKRNWTPGVARFFFWLVWTFSPMLLIAVRTPLPRQLVQVLSWVWAAGVFGLPLWWGIRWAQRKEMGKS